MDRKFLEGLGLDKETVDKVLDKNSEDIGVKVAEINKLTGERDDALSKLGEAEKRARDAEKKVESAGDAGAIQKKLDELQAKYDEDTAKMRMDNDVELALRDAGARSTKAVRALLDAEKIAAGEDGKLTGLNEQLEQLRKEHAYLFREEADTAGRVKSGPESGNPPKAVGTGTLLGALKEKYDTHQ